MCCCCCFLPTSLSFSTFSISIYIDGESEWKQLPDIDPSEGSAKIKDLDPDKTYVVKVSAKTSAGPGKEELAITKTKPSGSKQVEKLFSEPALQYSIKNC